MPNGGPTPTSAYYMLGAVGRYVVIIPSHDLVVVRIGFSKGERFATTTPESGVDAC